jgi:hypothetical protein
MSDPNGNQSKGPKLDAEEIRLILKSLESETVHLASSESVRPKFTVKSNEELRRLTAADLVESGKYTNIEEAMEDLRKSGF